MRLAHITPDRFAELPALPPSLPAEGFVWVGISRDEFEGRVGALQAALGAWQCGTLVDLHLSDMLNVQLRSHFDSTSWYDLLVFRRLLAVTPAEGATLGAADGLPSIDTSPVAFAVFDRVLVTVHPGDCLVRDHFFSRLAMQATVAAPDARGGTRLPTSAADLMLRMVNHIVDSYLALRRNLTHHFGQLQADLLGRDAARVRWHGVLEARTALQALEDTCEDQRSAIQEWIDALEEWPAAGSEAAQRERDLLRVRSRDVLEHIERVLGHVGRLEQSAETAVQIHFAAQGQRTNDIMRTLTVLTAIFLPLNLITGFFGMNFDAMPLIHSATGIWVAVVAMLTVGFGLGTRRAP